MMNTEVALSLGSNLGNRLENLILAKNALQSDLLIHGWTQSAVYKTAPVDCPNDAPDFYNTVVKFHYQGSPEVLLDLCQSIETNAGRDLELKKTVFNAPRIVDVDLLYYGQSQIATERLIIPHQRMHERRFVLEPLASIAPNFFSPSHSATISELLNTLSSDEPALIVVSTEW